MRKNPQAPTIKVNTENILFIAGGSFEHIEKIIAKRQNKNLSTLGIGVTLEDKNKDRYNELIQDVKVEDLKTFGMLPEFLGRFPVICSMEDLDEEALLKILTEPKDALVKQYQTLFQHDGTELNFSDAALKKIVDEAVKRKTGARSLRGIMEDVLRDTMYEIPDENISKVTVDVTEDNFSISKET